MTARTPHGKALDDYLLRNGPTPRRELMEHVAKFVPVGQAVHTVMVKRQSQRKKGGWALDVPSGKVAQGYESLHVDETAAGSRLVARATLDNRLHNKTVFVNEDGLIQHRDWKPE